MHNTCRPSLLPWGNESIAWIAEHLRHSWLDPIVLMVSHLGEMACVLLMLSIAYWFWNKRHAKFLCYGMFATLLINILLKGWIMECRPPAIYWLEKITPGSYSFPSGHAQVCILLWVGLAYFIRSQSTLLSISCITIGLLIALSRPYLGVHYVHDVVAGVMIGLAVLGCCLYFDKKQRNSNNIWPFWSRALILGSFLTLYQYIVNSPTGLSVIATSGLFGFWLGCQLEQKYCCFIPSKQINHIAIQLVIGCLGIGIIWLGGNMLRSNLPHIFFLDFAYLQYMFLGLWISFGAPSVFVKYQLMTRQSPDAPNTYLV